MQREDCLPSCETAYDTCAGDSSMTDWNDILKLSFEYAVEVLRRSESDKSV
jgi:hypothetical protein